jgi:hypothetical protein
MKLVLGHHTTPQLLASQTWAVGTAVEDGMIAETLFVLKRLGR